MHIIFNDFMEINQKAFNQNLESIVKTIAYNAKRIRVDKGYTEIELAKKMQSHTHSLKRLETTKCIAWEGRPEKQINIPLLSTLNKLSMICNVCITEFFKPIPCQ